MQKELAYAGHITADKMIDALCAQREQLKAELPRRKKHVPTGEIGEELRYFSDSPDQPPFLKALAEVRRIAVHEGWCYHHVQAIMIAIDQYAEAALGNREFFWNRPYVLGARGIGMTRRDECCLHRGTRRARHKL